MNKIFLATVATGIVFLSACGQESPVTTAADSAPASETEDATAASAADTASGTQTPESAAADAGSMPEQLTEIDEGESESVGEAPVASGTSAPIRLASAAETRESPLARFKEGVNYLSLVPAQPTSVSPDKVEVLEVFWYGCGHCYELDPLLENWRLNGKASYVEFHRLPAMWNDTLRMHARLFFTVELLGKLEELHTPIFREIHVNRNPLNTVEQISRFMRDHGVSAEDFQKTFTSFAVESKLQRADVLNRRYRVQGVPMVVVNGKYTADVGTAGGQQQLLELINDLSAREHGAG